MSALLQLNEKDILYIRLPISDEYENIPYIEEIIPNNTKRRCKDLEICYK